MTILESACMPLNYIGFLDILHVMANIEGEILFSKYEEIKYSYNYLPEYNHL